MIDNTGKLKDFVDMMVTRGLGLYGQERMARLCFESGIALTDQNEVDWIDDDHFNSVQKLLAKYGSQSLPAKMTAIVLARSYNIPLPEVLTTQKKKKKSRWRIFRRKKG